MKLLSFEHGGAASWGGVVGNGVVDLGARTEFKTLRAALEAEALGKLDVPAEADFGLDEIRYAIPLPDAPKILCIGVNYANRNEEYKDGQELPPYPSMFFRVPGSFVGHNEHILRPPESDKLDYEGEIVLVIGKKGRRIKAENWADHVAGMTILNEGTIRDWCRHAKFNVTQGKNFQSSGAIGPWMVTMDELADVGPQRILTKVNGEVRQDDTTDSIIFDFGYLLNYVSTFMEIGPGDMISTGTPTGAGTFFDPPKFLVPGDKIEIEVTGIGTLANEVADEKV